MTNSSDESDSDQTGVGDDQLPEDLRPDDDNPLAEGLDSGETAGDIEPGELLEEGKSAEHGDGESDSSEDPEDPEDPEG